MNSWRTILQIIAIGVTLCFAAQTAADPFTIIGYSKDGSKQVGSRVWNDTSNIWGSETLTPEFIKEPDWVVIKSCPQRDEAVVGVMGSDKELEICFFDGTSWGAITNVCSDTDMATQRCYALEYENRSGDLLICYWSKAFKMIGFRTWDGTTLSTESLLALPSDKKLRYVGLYPKANSNEIMLLALNDDKEIYAAPWDGTSFGTVTLIEDDTGNRDQECMSFAWESVSGEGLLTYMAKDQVEPHYRTWINSTWSVDQVAPSVEKKQRWHRLAADPASNQILFASLDDDKDVNVIAWSGSSWGTVLEVCSETQDNDRRQFDIAYEEGGTEAMVSYVPKDQFAIHYRTWNGSAWSSELVGANLGDRQRIAAISRGIDTGEIFVLVDDDEKDLNFMRWSGSSLSGSTALCAPHGGDDKMESYMLNVPRPSGLRVVNWEEVDPGN